MTTPLPNGYGNGAGEDDAAPLVAVVDDDDLLGIASGATGNPVIPAYRKALTPTGKPDIHYAIAFPCVGTIVTIVAVQILAAAHRIAAS
jgi:hypothetical protein